MRRGDVYDTRFDPIEGSEASGRRPAVIVSRDSFNAASPVVHLVRHRVALPRSAVASVATALALVLDLA